nr:unnamed protein product [Callosobruchus chinensis]
MQKWNFPNCVGAIDGKHVNLKAPTNSGSLNFNYKHSHSIVLLGLADANYQFTYINVGSAGRNSDGGVYVNSRLSKALENNSMIFNYRLSRARRIIENVFGFVSARFRVLRRNIELSEQKATQIVCAVCVLHNFIMSRKQSALAYAPNGTFDVDNEDGTITPGSWRNEVDAPLPGMVINHTSRNASVLAKHEILLYRQEFRDYFCREGEVPWQRNFI